MPVSSLKQGRTVFPGTPPYPRLLLLTALLGGPALADDMFLDNQDLPQVLTATRLKQSPAAVPGSMTVLDSELIRASGARDIPELMRLVPGMMVGYVAGNQPTVNYHGSNVNDARRMQVLIDGRSVYRAGLATVDWSDIPLAIEDIDRIEVFRGPNTVSYGANALMAVVNILTRNPADSHGTRVKVTRGQDGINDYYASQGFGWEGGDMRLSLSGMQDDGFDEDQFGNDYRDSRRLNRFNLSASHNLAVNQTLEWQLAAKEGSNQRPYTYQPVFRRAPSGDNADVNAKDYAGSVRWNIDFNPEHSFYVQTSAQQFERDQVWRACDAALAFSPEMARLWQLDPDFAEGVARNIQKGPAHLPSTNNPVLKNLLAEVERQWTDGANQTICGDVDQSTRETRFDLEIQDTLSLTDNLRLLSGMNYRYDRADSQTYFNGSLDDQTWRLFGQLEWRADEHWILQGGAMLEDSRLSGSSLTPRMAVNYLITPRHGLRAVYSEAVRSPDMFENNVNWSYTVDNLTPNYYGFSSGEYFVKTRGPGNLEQERMRSRELGYNGNFSDIDLSMDVKLFYDEITGMISEPLRNNQYIASNANKARFSGSETQLDWRPTLRDRLRLTYAYVDAWASNPNDRRLSARNSGSAGWMHEWGDGWSSALFYYGDDALNQYRYERLDLRVAKRLRIQGSNLELAALWQQRLDDEPVTVPQNRYDSRHRLSVSAELEF
ncbi:TonB-dependent receptor [Pseudomonas guariconensis]|uniref:TonB-dependent receptor plug domain-containing protein n=1 Tax=Pseudomonas guariconensis TaxID=1288410 RepID=UPI0018AA5FA4|nr:TonB-dependent receptor [Pseudomonas guariconensis]MBF8730946.1 TonB-dependent receptor [Pseudomonas guariconensis]